MAQIAVLGMGAMGSRMANALLEAGHHVAVWNLIPEACAPLAALGATVASTPYEAAAHAEFVIAMVWDDEASRYVWLDPDIGALAAMRPGTIALECATLSMAHEAMLADAFAARDIEFVSAPMSGSLPEADNKTLVFTVGATPEAFARVTPVLMAMGQKINHAGGPLDGISEKLIINGKLAIEYVAMAEIVALMRAAEMDCDRRMAIKASTAPFSARGMREAGFMLIKDESVRVKVAQLIKDLKNQIAQFDAHEVNCPLHRAALDVFERAASAGHGQADAVVLARLM
jgi:3-hydroxyisobutyrate dehydrogenase